jgi:hypothetical protein
MNRRGFLTALLAGAVAPAFLPGAGRLWKPTPLLRDPILHIRHSKLNPAYIDAPYQMSMFWVSAEDPSKKLWGYEPSDLYSDPLTPLKDPALTLLPRRFIERNGLFVEVPPYLSA